MKKTKKDSSYYAVFHMMAFMAIVGFIYGVSSFLSASMAATLGSASDVLSGTYKTSLGSDVSVGGTLIATTNGTGFTASDYIYVRDLNKSVTGAIVSRNGNDLTIDPIRDTFYSASGVDVGVISGIKHTVSFTAATTAIVDRIRFTFSDEALGDWASFEDVTFSYLSGISGSSTPQSASSGSVVFQADGGSLITAGSGIIIALNNVRNPHGSSDLAYSINIETLNVSQQIIDSALAFFVVDSEFVFQTNINSSLSLIISDDGTKNNPSDSATDDDINLSTLKQYTLDDENSGFGIDGNKITISTNAVNGYSITINDGEHGLINDNFSGSGRGTTDTDNGIDDIAGPSAWAGTGNEAYGYSVGASLDTTGVALNYESLSATPVSFKSSATPVISEETYVTVRAQIAPTTPAGIYTDNITYTIVPNF